MPADALVARRSRHCQLRQPDRNRVRGSNRKNQRVNNGGPLSEMPELQGLVQGPKVARLK